MTATPVINLCRKTLAIAAMNLIHILQFSKVEWTVADHIDLFGGYLDLFIGPAVSLADKAEGKFTTDQLLVIVSGIV